MLATPDPSCAATCNLCLILALMICHLQVLFSSEGGLMQGLNTNSRLVWPSRYFDAGYLHWHQSSLPRQAYNAVSHRSHPA